MAVPLYAEPVRARPPQSTFTHAITPSNQAVPAVSGLQHWEEMQTEAKNVQHPDGNVSTSVLTRDLN